MPGKIPNGVIACIDTRLQAFKDECPPDQMGDFRNIRITIEDVLNDCPTVGRDELEAAWSEITPYYERRGEFVTDHHHEPGHSGGFFLDFMF